MELIKELSEQVLINGKLVEIEIKIHAEPEQNSVEGDFDFGDEIENKKYLKRFEDGELQLISIRVQAKLEDLCGVDYLGMCHIKSDSFTQDIIDMAKYYDMADQAIEDLKSKIKRIVDAIS